ncbi:hypothetical protein BGZ60DRAFT_415671 [Tricladium varicosporioides]|nr:hypothetical protein BGZ60DRAFT_415671 [Hymenoscyphus varicosporioides]
MSKFESKSGKWAPPSVMYTGIANGPLAAMGFWKDETLINEKNPPHDFQTELFSIGENSNITEWNIVNDSQVGPIPKWNATRSTNIACYWPICAWQDDTGTIRHFWYDYSLGWFETSFPNTLGTKQSGLGIIPMQQTFEGTSIFYQRDDGVLAEWWQPVNGAWAAGSTLDVIPKSAQLGAFATPRDDGIHTNRYILWQNTTGDIVMKWDDGPTGWKGPVGFPALKGADNGTQIACLTPANKYHSPMGNKTDMGRCYFQAGGAVREVLYANRDWTIVGNISIS